MSRTQHNYKFKLMKQEEARNKTTCETGTINMTFATMVYSVAVSGGVTLIFLVISYCSSNSMKDLKIKTESILSFYRGPIYAGTVNGFLPQNNSIYTDLEQIHENENSQNKKNNFSYQHNYLEKNSFTSAFSLKIIENELIKSKVELKSPENKKGDIDEVASHTITENGEKQILNNNFFNQSKDNLTNKAAEVIVPNAYNFDTDYRLFYLFVVGLIVMCCVPFYMFRDKIRQDKLKGNFESFHVTSSPMIY